MSRHTHAAKFTAAYVQGTYGFSFTEFLTGDPKIKTLRMIPYSGVDSADRVSAQKEATKLVGHILSLGFNPESGDSIMDALLAAAELIKTGEEKASALANAVNAGFIFQDEIDGDGETA